VCRCGKAGACESAAMHCTGGCECCCKLARHKGGGAQLGRVPQLCVLEACQPGRHQEAQVYVCCVADNAGLSHCCV
jgi:hypothetical protein